jgi:hypothetical protein
MATHSTHLDHIQTTVSPLFAQSNFEVCIFRGLRILSIFSISVLRTSQIDQVYSTLVVHFLRSHRLKLSIITGVASTLFLFLATFFHFVQHPEEEDACCGCCFSSTQSSLTLSSPCINVSLPSCDPSSPGLSSSAPYLIVPRLSLLLSYLAFYTCANNFLVSGSNFEVSMFNLKQSGLSFA